jgi:hypothetical protein
LTCDWRQIFSDLTFAEHKKPVRHMTDSTRCFDFHHAKRAMDEKVVRYSTGGGRIHPLLRITRNQFNVIAAHVDYCR